MITGLVLVTDAISAMGLAEGKHRIGQFEIEVRENKAFVAGTNTLCGSIATMNDCVKIFKEATGENLMLFKDIGIYYFFLEGCSSEYALEAASLHPALAMGISHQKGTLNFETDADFIFLNNDLEVLETWIAGERVYSKLL